MTVRQLLLLVSLITLCLFPPLLVSAAQAAHSGKSARLVCARS